MFPGTTPDEVADAIREEISNHAGLDADECGEIHITAIEMTQEEIDKIPEEFSGW